MYVVRRLTVAGSRRLLDENRNENEVNLPGTYRLRRQVTRPNLVLSYAADAMHLANLLGILEYNRI